MAGDWIKMRNDLAEDPAVIGIAAELGIEEFAVVGRLQALWAWADAQSRDGHAVGVTPAWIDRKVQRDGFASAMCKFRWLVVTDDGISFPNFENHNGDTAKTRALGTNRKKNQRARDAVTPPSADGHADGVTKAGPEKRREEPSSLRSEDVAARATPGEACMAMKAAGMAGVSPSHPKLIALLDAGIAVSELVDAATDAVKTGKPFAYALAAAEGRRRDAATAPLPDARSPQGRPGRYTAAAAAIFDMDTREVLDA